MIDLVGNIALGDAKARSADVLGHVFEYFLGEFALAEGKKGGQLYTPRSVVELLVEMLEPYKGRVFDPCCESNQMFWFDLGYFSNIMILNVCTNPKCLDMFLIVKQFENIGSMKFYGR